MYHYTVDYLDEDQDYCLRKETGLVASKSYYEAVERVCKFYGKNIISIKVTEWEDIVTEDEITEGFQT